MVKTRSHLNYLLLYFCNFKLKKVVNAIVVLFHITSHFPFLGPGPSPGSGPGPGPGFGAVIFLALVLVQVKIPGPVTQRLTQ